MKGIWKNPPPGWPSDIEFVDPNNKMKALTDGSSTKPKKQLLLPMLRHLVTKYRVSVHVFRDVPDSSISNPPRAGPGWISVQKSSRGWTWMDLGTEIQPGQVLERI